MIAALVAAVYIGYTKFKPSPAPVADATSTSTESSALNESHEAVANVQPADTDKSVESVIADSLTDPAVAFNESTEQAQSSNAAVQAPAQNFPELYGYEIGHNSLSDEDMLALIRRLRNDPVLLSDLLNELRAETDPARLKRLAALLGDSGHADVLPVAEELIYSSNPDTREAGLDLLSRVAPKNPEAYDIANAILGSEADADVLVSTMNVLALPRNATPESRATSITQVMPLANHESAAVRRHSVSILVRLTNDQSLSPVLSNALHDPDPAVREAAVYAYATYPYQTAEAVQRLVDLVADPNEERGVRNGAILALNNMSPDEATQAVISTAKKQMRDALRAR